MGPLFESVQEWLGPHVWNGAETGDGPILDGKSLTLALIDRLGWREKERMDREAPEYFVTPPGKRTQSNTPRGFRYSSPNPGGLGAPGKPRFLGENLVFPFAVSRRTAASNNRRYCRFLEGLLRRRTPGDAGPIPQTLLAREPA